jgi:hypothetical protein
MTSCHHKKLVGVTKKDDLDWSDTDADWQVCIVSLCLSFSF